MAIEVSAHRLWLWHAGRGDRGACCRTLSELLDHHLRPAGFTGEVGPGQAITLIDGPGVASGTLVHASRAVGGDSNRNRL